MRPAPESCVLRWIDAQAEKGLYLSTTTLAELLSGLSAMPDGRRKLGLEELLRRLCEEWYSGRVLPFTEEAAERYGGIMSRARANGRRIELADGQIAAVAAVHGFAVATRDTRPFEAAGVAVINPWVA